MSRHSHGRSNSASSRTTLSLPNVPRKIRGLGSLSADEKRVGARLMEAYAGFADHTDVQVGRMVDALQEMGALDNTLFVYILGDNGASAEGGPEGALNELAAAAGRPAERGRNVAASRRDRRAQ